MSILLSDAPETESTRLRPSILALVEQLSHVIASTPAGGGICIDGPSGSGRSTLLYALRERAGGAFVDLATLPQGAAVLPALVGAILRSDDPKRARRARVATQRLGDVDTFNRHEPGAHDPVQDLAGVLGDTSMTLFIDGAPRQTEELTRALAILRHTGGALVFVATGAAPLPVRIDLGRLDPLETAALTPVLASLGPAPLSPLHTTTLQTLYADPIFANPRRLKRAIRTLSLLRAFEGDADDGEDAAIAQWVGTVTLWPRLAEALRARDGHWWRDLRLAMDQAMPVRPDPLAGELLHMPGFGPWLAAHVPRPSPAAPRAFGQAIDSLRHAQARLDRWGL